MVEINQVIRYNMFMVEVTKDKVFNKKEIIGCLFGYRPKISEVSIYKAINKKILSNEITRVGRNKYSFSSKKSFSYTLEKDFTKKVLNDLTSRFGNDSLYIVYDTSLLNLFLNHLIGNFTVIIEVEKILKKTVFWYLKEKGYQSVLLSPSEEENSFYNPFDGTGIIVKTMVSKSPINSKQHKTTIEKLVVDIVSDKTLNMFYEGAEIPLMLDEIFHSYSLKLDSIRNYAKRRHCLDKLVACLPNDMKGIFEK